MSFIVFSVLTITGRAAAEDRILWVSIGDGPTNTTNLQNAVNFAVNNKFNAICILARYRADALYIPNRDYNTYSNPEPRRSSSIDSVQYIIDRGREAGLRIYAAWGCFMVSDGATNPYPSHLPSGSILWVYRDVDAPVASDDNTYNPDAGYPRAMTPADDSNQGLWADPGRNDVQIYSRNVLKDFVQNYDIDGIILDRIRYRGDALPHRNMAFGYNPQALSDLVAKGYISNTTPGPGSGQFINARRNAIRDFISDARADVHALKPWIIFGATPVVYSTTLNSTYNTVFQYFPGWNAGANSNHVSGLGILDMISPQYYRNTASANRGLMDLVKPDVTNMSHQATFNAGLEPADQLAQNICDTRAATRPMNGFGIFSMGYVSAAGYMSTVNSTATSPCGTGVMSSTSPLADFTIKNNWDSLKPNNITNLTATASTAEVQLNWSGPAAAGDGDTPVKYLVYRSSSSPVRQYYENLVNRNINVTGSSFTDNPSYGLTPGTKYYKVIPVDDYNNKSDSNQVSVVVTMPESIVDNLSATFSGSWATASASTDKYATDYRYSGSQAGTGQLRTATFDPNITTDGYYDVYEWHPQGGNRPTDARHIVNFEGGNQTILVNQQVNGGQWNLIGNFPMRSGQNNTVVINNSFNTGSVVMADAIRWLYTAPLPATGVEEWSLY